MKKIFSILAFGYLLCFVHFLQAQETQVKMCSVSQEVSVDISKQFDSSLRTWVYAPFSSLASHLLGSLNNKIVLSGVLDGEKIKHIKASLNGTVKKSLFGLNVSMSISSYNLDKSVVSLGEFGNAVLKNTYIVRPLLKVESATYTSTRSLDEVLMILEVQL